jgi:hypothetical protein
MPALVPWFIAGAAGGLVIPAMVTVFQVAATARYLQDTLPVATLLGAVGLWWLRAGATSAIRRHATVVLAAAVLLLSVTVGGLLGVAELSWDKLLAYARLTYTFDRAVTGVLQITQPSTWQDRYFSTARERLIWAMAVGPFYVEGDESRINTAPAERALRSMQASSVYDQPMRIIVELNGVQVADERVFPGLQVLFLDEPIPIDSAKPVALRVRFPDLPDVPAGSLRPVSLYNATSRPDYTPAESQVAMIVELRKQVEQDSQVVTDLLGQLNAAAEQSKALEAAIKAGTAGPDAPQRLEEQKARVTALDQAHQEAVIKTTQDTAHFRTEERYIQEKEARANAARAKP